MSDANPASRPSPWSRWPLADLHQLSEEVAAELYARACRACPGRHNPQPHRDGKAPWCRFCGCTEWGRRVAHPQTTTRQSAARETRAAARREERRS